MVMIRSCTSSMRIERPDNTPEVAGSEFIGFWIGAMMRDLYHVIDVRSTAAERAPVIALAANRWFTQTWSGPYAYARQFEISALGLTLHSELDGLGRTLATINVLTGTYELL